MGGGLGRVTHHPDYYIEDGSVSFLTEGVLFRIHKTFFQRESQVFRDLFENTADDDPVPGTDACPFTLDVAPDDFAKFLWVWYDREYDYRQQTKENWVTILDLATRWHFDKIRELALREIESLELPPAERISIYDDYGIDGERLISSCVELCKSPRLPTPNEARTMRMDTLIKLLQAREDGHRKAVELGLETPTSACLEDEALREIVSKHFERGLNPRSGGTSTGSEVQALDLNKAQGSSSGPSTTIILEVPQVPEKKTQTTSHPSSYLTNGGGNQKKPGDRAESNDVHKEGSQAGGEAEKKSAEDKAKQTKEKPGTGRDKGKEAEGKGQKADQKSPENARGKTRGG